MKRPAGRVLLPLLLGTVTGMWLGMVSWPWWHVIFVGILCVMLPLGFMRKHCFSSSALLAALIICGLLLVGSTSDTSSGLRVRGQSNEACRRIDRIWSGRESALFKGLLGGEPDSLSRSEKRSFRHSGLAHLLAVSGIHVGIIGRVVILCSRGLNINKRLAYIPVILLLPLYIIMLGWKVSVVRAVIMGVLAAAGTLMGSRGERINSLYVAALAIILVDPWALMTVAFQLSFAATFGIIVTMTGQKHNCRKSFWRKITYAIGDTFTVSLIAQVWVLPLVAWHFRSIPLLAPVSNVLAFPLVFFLVPAGYACLALSSVSFAAARILGRLLVWPASWFMQLLSVLGNSSGSVVSVQRFDGFWLCSGYVLLLGTMSANETMSRVSRWSVVIYLGAVLFLC